jgi:N-acyl-D-amino-acid deacylase
MWTGTVSKPTWQCLMFDPATVIDRATFQNPHQYANGFQMVFVNGQVVFENDEMTQARPGRVLYGPARR